MSVHSVCVIPYVEKNDFPDGFNFTKDGPVKCHVFHRVRNDLLATLRLYGTVGPMGEFSLRGNCKYLREGERGLGPTSGKPTFFVVSDRYNEWTERLTVEASLADIQHGLLASVVTMLQQHHGWKITFALRGTGFVISSTEIEYYGERFLGSETMEDLELRCQPIN